MKKADTTNSNDNEITVPQVITFPSFDPKAMMAQINYNLLKRMIDSMHRSEIRTKMRDVIMDLQKLVRCDNDKVIEERFYALLEEQIDLKNLVAAVDDFENKVIEEVIDDSPHVVEPGPVLLAYFDINKAKD